MRSLGAKLFSIDFSPDIRIKASLGTLGLRRNGTWG